MVNAIVPATPAEITSVEQINSLWELKKQLDDFFKSPDVIERCKDFEDANFKVIQSNRTKCDYSSSNHPQLNALYEIKGQVDKQIKTIENLLKSLDQPMDVLIEGVPMLNTKMYDVPELVKINPPAKTVTVSQYLKSK